MTDFYVSVIIPTYNRKNNVLAVLKCLSTQILEPTTHMEVIVVDDNSDDNTTPAIVAANYPLSLKIVYRTGRSSWNASVPRNLGARISKRESTGLLFLDSDVLLPDDRIQKYVDDYAADPDPNRVIIGPYHFLQQPLITSPYELVPHWYKQNIINYSQDIRWKSFEEHPVTEKNSGVGFALACFGGSIMIPRKLFFKVNGYDEHCVAGTEDGDMGLTLWESGAVFSMDQQLLGWHHPHPILPSRTERIPEMITYIDKKHGMDIVKETGETYRSWGIKWSDPTWSPVGKTIEEDIG